MGDIFPRFNGPTRSFYCNGHMIEAGGSVWYPLSGRHAPDTAHASSRKVVSTSLLQPPVVYLPEPSRNPPTITPSLTTILTMHIYVAGVNINTSLFIAQFLHQLSLPLNLVTCLGCFITVAFHAVRHGDAGRLGACEYRHASRRPKHSRAGPTVQNIHTCGTPGTVPTKYLDLS